MENKKTIGVALILLLVLGILFILLNNKQNYNKIENNTVSLDNFKNVTENNFNLINSGSLNNLSFQTLSLGKNCGCYASACKIIIKDGENIIDEINSEKKGPCDNLSSGTPVSWFDDENIITKESFGDSGAGGETYYKYNIFNKQKTLIYKLSSNFSPDLPEYTIMFGENKYLIIEGKYLEIYKINSEEKLEYDENTFNTIFDENKMTLITKDEILTNNFEIIPDYKGVYFTNDGVKYSIENDKIIELKK